MQYFLPWSSLPLLICSDSPSCLLAIESCKTQNPYNVTDLISAKCCWISKGFVSDFLCCVSSKLKVGFGFNHGGFSGITIGAMSSKSISEFSKCVFTRSPKGWIVPWSSLPLLICSDSLSCLLAIESCKTQNPYILKIVEIYKSLVAIGKHVIFTSVHSHSKFKIKSRFCI
jgi:hypothetical protein